MNLNPKVRNGTVGGALSVLLCWLLTGPLGIDLPNEVLGSIPVIVYALVAYGTSQGAWTSKSDS
jgi:hypothetical protein